MASANTSAGPDIAGLLSNQAIVYLILVSPMVIAPIADTAALVLCALAALTLALLYCIAHMTLGHDRDQSSFLAVPLAISATQNVYLGLLAPALDPLAIQLALLAHIFFMVGFLGIHLFKMNEIKNESYRTLIKISVALILLLGAFGAVSVAALHAPLVAMVTSARNMVSPIIFLTVALLVGRHTRIESFAKLVILLAWFTLVFGLVEYVFSDLVWHTLNIDILWIKKGIPNLASWGLPANFVSSERFFGEQIRRMASSYADPVNFGTMLFAFFALAWFSKRWSLAILCAFAIALSVSKGAMLGLLIFAVVWTYHYGGRLMFFMGTCAAGVIGVGVVAYTMLSSTQSLAAHLQGFSAAILSLPAHPFGRGLGGVGVLAEGTSDIRESGFGLIIGQLGILAFPIFGAFFLGIWKSIGDIIETRGLVLAKALYFSIVVNITFNEVALSPNSCAIYFLLIGLLISQRKDTFTQPFLYKFKVPFNEKRVTSHAS